MSLHTKSGFRNNGIATSRSKKGLGTISGSLMPENPVEYENKVKYNRVPRGTWKQLPGYEQLSLANKEWNRAKRNMKDCLLFSRGLWELFNGAMGK